MWSAARSVAEGDVVIVWLTRDAVHPLTIAAGHHFNGRFGSYAHSDLIGIPYGSKVPARTGRGFIHVLRPTPELWTLALPHRTQILYLADIAFISARLALRPGARVIEAGTGSASFTHAVARTVGPTGRVYTFEFHHSRAAKARDEFAQHGLASYVLLHHRNVCRDGFGPAHDIDAVFLDLPAPWDAIPHAKLAARKDRIVHICCFSPCIEQVLRTVSALNEHGFTDIKMYETLLRPHEVAQLPAPAPVSFIRDKLQRAEVGKEQRRLKQIAVSRARRAEPGPSSAAGAAEVRSANHDGAGKGRDKGKEKGKNTPTHTPTPTNTHTHTPTHTAPLTITTTHPIKEVRGHTSYLTFACLLPSPVPVPTAVPTATPTTTVPTATPTTSKSQSDEAETEMAMETAMAMAMEVEMEVETEPSTERIIAIPEPAQSDPESDPEYV
ncbi:tRNA methyltransferase complex GCD14 subunit [Ramaria rubella]|nr:tRNA methyltransferase complex GCD14 subunit [Ramaria rubella]